MWKFLLILTIVSLAASTENIKSQVIEEIEELKGKHKVKTNPTHYGNPDNGCLPDEITGNVYLGGKGCFPECTDNPCPTDEPEGNEALPGCFLTHKNKKYCILICKGIMSGVCEPTATCADVSDYGVCLYDSKSIA